MIAAGASPRAPRPRGLDPEPHRAGRRTRARRRRRLRRRRDRGLGPGRRHGTRRRRLPRRRRPDAPRRPPPSRGLGAGPSRDRPGPGPRRPAPPLCPSRLILCRALGSSPAQYFPLHGPEREGRRRRAGAGGGRVGGAGVDGGGGGGRASDRRPAGAAQWRAPGRRRKPPPRGASRGPTPAGRRTESNGGVQPTSPFGEGGAEPHGGVSASALRASLAGGRDPPLLPGAEAEGARGGGRQLYRWLPAVPRAAVIAAARSLRARKIATPDREALRPYPGRPEGGGDSARSRPARGSVISVFCRW